MSNEASTTTPIRVLLADDHDILRQGLKLLLGLQQDIQVVGEARTGREALTMACDLKPDVVVMDISMADIDGLEACRLIRVQQPAIQVLMLTMHESEEYFLQALRMGAAGYLVKKAAPLDKFGAGIGTIHGHCYVWPCSCCQQKHSVVCHSAGLAAFAGSSTLGWWDDVYCNDLPANHSSAANSRAHRIITDAPGLLLAVGVGWSGDYGGNRPVQCYISLDSVGPVY